jgi:hypothetical protein
LTAAPPECLRGLRRGRSRSGASRRRRPCR